MKRIRKLDLERSPTKTKKRYCRLYLVLGGIVGLIGVLIWLLSLRLVNPTSVVDLVLSSPPRQIASTNGRVNILLLGIGGGKHEGPNLTDSIIVASYHLDSRKVMLFSLPRDLWIESQKQKINAIYESGLRQGKSLYLVKQIVGELMGLSIHYAVRVDFSGFVKAVDLVGGIEVEVPITFDDYLYPVAGRENDSCGLSLKEVEVATAEAELLNLTPGLHQVWVRPDNTIATQSADFWCRYEHIHFDKGKMWMDGETALKFVRSRHGTNGEGSDFARSRRQQLVLEAFRQKALSLPILSSPNKVLELIETFKDSIDTDIPQENYLDFYNLIKNMVEVKSVVLGDLGDGRSLFINPPLGEYGGAWVLVPVDYDYREIAKYVREKLDEQVATPQPTILP